MSPDATDQVLDMVIATLGEAEQHDEHWERQARAVLAACRKLEAVRAENRDWVSQ